MLKVLLVFLILPMMANAATYAVICTVPCIASDGTTQPVGTVLNRIIADASFKPGAGLALAPDTGKPVYQPPAPLRTLIPTSEYAGRFTPAEQAAIAGNTTTLIFWLTVLSYQNIDLTDSRVTAGMAALVAAGILMPERAAIILSPGP